MRTYVLTYCLTWSDQNRAYGGTYPKHKYGILSILTPRLSPLSKSTYGYDGALTKLSNGYLRDGALLFFDSYRSDTYILNRTAAERVGIQRTSEWGKQAACNYRR